MINISPVITASLPKNNNIIKCSQPLKDTFIPSFKGYNDVEDDVSSPIFEFFFKLKLKKNSISAMNKSYDIFRFADIEHQHAEGVVDSKLFKIKCAQRRTPELIKQKNGKKYLEEFDKNNSLKNIVFFNEDGTGIHIDHIDVYSEDGRKNEIITDENNHITMLRFGVRQIGPQSYLEDKAVSYKNGDPDIYYESSRRVNDGVASSKTEEKNNIYKFEDGMLSSYIPKATYLGNDLYYAELYLFEDDRLKSCLIDVIDDNGILFPTKRYTF